jgi:hypothetical protein
MIYVLWHSHTRRFKVARGWARHPVIPRTRLVTSYIAFLYKDATSSTEHSMTLGLTCSHDDPCRQLKDGHPDAL